MDDSDNLIISTLRNMGFPLAAELDNAKRITSDDFRSIILHFFKMMGLEIKHLESNEASQKFRTSNKICEELSKNFGIRCDVNSLMNPNINDLRKTLVAIISKAAMDEEENKEKGNFQSLEDQILFEREKVRQTIIKDWLKEDWILPEIIDSRFNNFRNFDLNVELGAPSLRKRLIIGNLSGLKGIGVFSALARKLNIHEEKRRKKEQNLEKEYFKQTNKGDIRNREELKNIKLKNKLDWLSVTSQKKKLGRLLKKQKEKEEQEEQQTNEAPQKDTMFSLEINFQEEVVELNPQTGENAETAKVKNTETDVETLKAKNKEEMEGLIEALHEKKDHYEMLESSRQDTEDQSQKLEEEIMNLKASYLELQKRAEDLHNVLQHLEKSDKSQAKIEQETRLLEKEIKDMEDEWAQHEEEMQQSLQEFTQKQEEKKEKLNIMREKIRTYEEDYEKIILDARSNQIQIESLQKEFQKATKDILRNAYVKRINDVNNNFNKQKNEFGKINAELKDLESSVQFYLSNLTRHYTEIENMLTMDKKGDSNTKHISRLYNEFKQLFDSTMKNLQDQGKRKLESRSFELQIDLLQAKKYKATIEKMLIDIEEVRAENSKLQKMV